jgi:hypothetical protein
MQETTDLMRLRAVPAESRAEVIWIDDELPASADPSGQGEGWTWIRAQPDLSPGGKPINRLWCRASTSISSKARSELPYPAHSFPPQ